MIKISCFSSAIPMSSNVSRRCGHLLLAWCSQMLPSWWAPRVPAASIEGGILCRGTWRLRSSQIAGDSRSCRGIIYLWKQKYSYVIFLSHFICLQQILRKVTIASMWEVREYHKFIFFTQSLTNLAVLESNVMSITNK